MAGHWTDRYLFLRGAVRFSDLAYMIINDRALLKNDVPHSAVIAWDSGSWQEMKSLEWSGVAISIVSHPIQQAIVVGNGGEVLLAGSGDIHEERIHPIGEDLDQVGEIRAVASVAGKAYAAGMDRRVFKREGENSWKAIDKTVRSFDSNDVVGFEAIAGFSENEIYAVGWGGEIWHFDGSAWHSVASPTNVILTGVCCAGDGEVYICGRMGMLIKGRHENWEIIEHESTQEDFWSVEWFNGKIFLATTKLIYELQDNELIPTDFEADIPSSCYNLSASDGVMWSFGPSDVMALDDEGWNRID